MFRTLGLSSDALVMEGASLFTDHRVYIEQRTPKEPDYWFGNCLILRDTSLAPQEAVSLFQTSFPEARHRCLKWDLAAAPDLAPFVDMGFEIEVSEILNLTGPLRRPALPSGLVLRPLESDEDWALLEALAQEIGVEDGYEPESHLRFLRKRYQRRRHQVRAGKAAWFGVFDGAVLSASMGLFHSDRILRFQDVQTRRSHRRLGICAALLAHVCSWGQSLSPGALPVIVADAGKPAGRIYRRSGFALCERVGAVLRPAH
ncbi:MAG: GNAT family N-acetyltransferase [Pseudomonadota bacterium]